MRTELKPVIEAIADRDVDLTELAFAAGVSVATIKRRERGDSPYVVDELVRIARHFGISLTGLLVDADAMPYSDPETYIKGGSNGMTVDRATDGDLAIELARRLSEGGVSLGGYVAAKDARPAHWGEHRDVPEGDYDLAASKDDTDEYDH